MTRTLHIVEPRVDFNKINPNSILLTDIDSDFNNNHYHTSIADLSDEDICKVVHHFDYINFVPTKFETDSTLYKETVILLNYLSHRCRVLNFESAQPKQFISNKEIFDRPNEPVLWVFGCSHSYGTGLVNPEQRFGSLLSDKLNWPLKLIAKPGSSIEWSLQHLLHADIRPEDTVVWQLTTPERMSDLESFDKLPIERLLKTADKSAVEFYNDYRIFYKQVSSLNTGLKFLRNTKSKFLVTSLNGYSELNYQLLIEYSKHAEYVHTPNWIVDVAPDNIHAGPVSHDKLCKKLLTHLN